MRLPRNLLLISILLSLISCASAKQSYYVSQESFISVVLQLNQKRDSGEITQSDWVSNYLPIINETSLFLDHMEVADLDTANTLAVQVAARVAILQRKLLSISESKNGP